MEKALHDYFYINTGRGLEIYSSRDASALIEAANLHIESKNGNTSSGLIPELETFIYDCVDEYHQRGFSDKLLNKLNPILEKIKIQCLVQNIENELRAVHIASIPYNSTPLHLGAYMFFNIAALGGLEKIKRCQNEECLKFFIGRNNTKWCKSSCGSIYRVKKMRKNKRAAGRSKQWNEITL